MTPHEQKCRELERMFWNALEPKEDGVDLVAASVALARWEQALNQP